MDDSSTALADRLVGAAADIHPGYTHKWLEQQAVEGMLDDLVGEWLAAPGDDGVTRCHTATRAEGAFEKTGTVPRPDTVLRCTEHVGFGRVGAR
jgi:hypothetical protein